MGSLIFGLDVEIAMERGKQCEKEIRISVRGLVEFLLRCGDIDNRRTAAPDNAMQEGSRIHRMIQRRMGADYQAEVSLRHSWETEQYTLVVEGRADGIIDNDKETVIDEIKGTYRDVARMKGPVPVHAAQAKCYGYLYALQKKKEKLRVRMTYCNRETEDMRWVYEGYTFEELERWFLGLLEDYRRWADYAWQWKETRQASIAGLEFPFSYREGQKDLVSHVYRTIYHKKKLFLEAPTGTGKTIAALFPSIKAVGQQMADRIFYLTAKTITRTVAEDTLNLLRQKGLRWKSVILTAKEKICFLEEMECNPEKCPYAKGHYDRINDAIYDLLVNEESFTREKIEEYAKRHQVCPFEMCLDMSLFSDCVICDYNYLFDPHVYLKRFFGDGVHGEYIFLIDEAHNLLERGREMYSAVLVKEDFLEIRREVKQTAMSEREKKHRENQVQGQMTLDMTNMSVMEREREEKAFGEEDTDFSKGGRGAVSVLTRQGYGEKLEYHLDRCNKELLALKRECEDYRLIDSVDSFVQALTRLHSVLDEYLDEQEEAAPPVRERLLDFFFEVSHFLDIYERLDEHYVKYTLLAQDGRFLIKLFCVNPRENLKECMLRGRSTILFSATFLPIQYYKGLLGGDSEDYEVYAKTVFHSEKRGLFIAGDVTSRYTRRSEEEFFNIARYIDEIVKNRHGNYMVFCPSYSFLQEVYEKYQEHFADETRECILQSDYRREEEREAFLARFTESGDSGQEEKILIGFCVLGGIFGEGIDLKRDSLIGAVIVGTGLPQVCSEREILKNYFDQMGENGFDYSYRFPGMNKVLQAAGRVIRTAEDVGIVALLDERFLQPGYNRLFPREWEYFQEVSLHTVAGRVERFWDSWL